MIKHLTTHGNSLALIIDKPVLELLHIQPKTPLEIATDGTNIIVSPVKDLKRKKAFEKALSRVNQKHAATLKKLAE